MQNIKPEIGAEGLLGDVLGEKQAVIVVDRQEGEGSVGLAAQVAALAEENERLREKLREKEKESEEKDKNAASLLRRAEEAQKALKVEQDRRGTDQQKIDKLTLQLQKVQKLLQKLLSRKKPSKLGAEFQSPQAVKQKFTLQTSKSKGEAITDHAFKSSRTDYIRDSPSVGASYSKMLYSPSSSFKGDSEEYRRYRREKLLASQNVGDILRIEKLMNN